jgi:hypothetical protein
MSESALPTRRKGDKVKVMMAARLWRQTTMTLKRPAEWGAHAPSRVVSGALAGNFSIATLGMWK